MTPARDPRPLLEHLLDEREAAEVLNVSARTLRLWRTAGTGPAHARLARTVRYRPADLAAYVEDRMVRGAQ